MASHPPKRVRTGCLKCRARRRKCDENKPRCQRCVAGGFECQYGTRLSFLQKNAITARAEEAAGPSAAYRRVQFVSDSVAQPPKRGAAPQDSPSLPPRFRIVHDSPYTKPRTPVSSGLSTAPTTIRGHIPSPTILVDAAQTQPLAKSPHSNYSWPESFAPAEGYEIALDALLSLGEDKSRTPTGRGHKPAPLLGSGGTMLSAGPAESDDSLASNLEGNTQYPDDAGAISVSESRALSLLRYYRYEIAPWLDLCDLGHTFGITVLCLASVSKPVLHSVLDFTTSLSRKSGGGESHHTISSTSGAVDVYTTQMLPAAVSTKLLCQVLVQSKRILTNNLGEPPHHDMAELGEMFSVPMRLAGRSLNVSLYFLALRLDLGESLASGQPPRLPLWNPRDFPFDGHRSEPAARIFHSASEILVLCAQAARLVLGSADTPSDTRVEQWVSLLDLLSSWYTSRCQTFRPMVDLDGKGGSFPTLLFTSGAGLMANQLYHTAMLLMLQSKLRTARVLGGRVASMSTLWHARRICGIALSNDARETWDPSLVASFVVAARGMTHADQHDLLLGRLAKVGRLTGWKVGYYRSTLMEEWGM